MCSLFGIIDYKNVLTPCAKNKILTILSRECEVRGTDATGIAYNYRNRIHIYKRPVAARKMRFHIPNGVNVVMGHTRMATQGDAKINRNNHPWATKNFALAHNGVLWNNGILREVEELPYTLIETDSYVAVQLLEKQETLNFDAIRTMAEKVQGSFVFTVLSRDNNMYFVRGDNPLSVFCYDGFYLYASTADILVKTELQLGLKHNNLIPIEVGEVLKIDRYGRCSWSYFELSNMWNDIGYPNDWNEFGNFSKSNKYIFETAKTMGIPSEDVRLLLHYGCDAGEIEELLYDPNLLHDIVSEIRCDWYGKEASTWDWVRS